MEGHIYKLISLDDVASEYPFSCRYSLKDEGLKASVKSHGILFPLVAIRRGSGNRKTLVAGHKRFHAARELGLKNLPVLEIQDEVPDSKLFLLAIFSNWNQAWPDLDRAVVLRRLKEDFGFKQEEIVRDFFPALGLDQKREDCDEWIQTARLDARLLNLVSEGVLPFRAARAFGRFSPADQEGWAGILTRASLSASQCWKAAEWAYDLEKKYSSDLKGFLAVHPNLEQILNHPKTDGRAKADGFFRALWEMRFPRLADREKKWAAVAAEISAGSNGFQIEAPGGFEEEGFTLKAKLKNGRSLDGVLKLLGEKRNLLNSLFDDVL